MLPITTVSIWNGLAGSTEIVAARPMVSETSTSSVRPSIISAKSTKFACALLFTRLDGGSSSRWAVKAAEAIPGTESRPARARAAERTSVFMVGLLFGDGAGRRSVADDFSRHLVVAG